MLTALLLFAGCVTRENFPEAYAAAACDYHERCGGDWQSLAEEDESCEDVLLRYGDFSYYVESESWSVGLAAECVHSLQEMNCDGTATLACLELAEEP